MEKMTHPTAAIAQERNDMTDLNKLADALENIAHMEYPSAHHDGKNLREAAALLRAAAGVDVAGLLDAADRYALAKADPAHWRAALELLLRLVLAQRVPPEPETKPFGGANDPLYADAVKIVRKLKRGSVSLVQRHLAIGYNRAQSMLEAMVGTVLAEDPPTTKLLPVAAAPQAKEQGNR